MADGEAKGNFEVVAIVAHCVDIVGKQSLCKHFPEQLGGFGYFYAFIQPLDVIELVRAKRVCGEYPARRGGNQLYLVARNEF